MTSSVRNATTKTSSEEEPSTTMTPKRTKNGRFCSGLLSADNGKQLMAIVWKTSIVRSVHWLATLIEIFLPLMAIYMSMNCLEPLVEPATMQFNVNQTNPPQIYAKPFFHARIPANISQLSKRLTRYVVPIYVYYNPLNSTIEDMMTSEFLQTVNGFSDYPTMIEVFHRVWKEFGKSSKSKKGITMFAIRFNEVNLERAHLSYNILHFVKKKSIKDDFFKEYDSKNEKNKMAPSRTHFFEFYQAMVAVIYQINVAFLNQVCGKTGKCPPPVMKILHCLIKDGVDIFRLPYPKHPNFAIRKINSALRPFLDKLDVYDTLALVILLVITIAPAFIVSQTVAEKSSRMKHLLEMLGLADWIYWLAHFSNYYFVHIIQATVITWILFGPPAVFVYSSTFVFLMAYLVYGVQMILFSLFWTTIFNRPMVAVITMIIFWIASSFGIFFLLCPSLRADGLIDQNRGTWPYLLSSMLPTGSLLWLLSIMGQFEKMYIGLHVWNMSHTTKTYKSTSFLAILLVVIASCFFYVFIIWYLAQVWPWQIVGVAKHPLFFLKFKSKTISKSKSKNLTNNTDTSKFESEPSRTQAVVRLINLRKEFTQTFCCFGQKKKVSVDGISLNIYAGHCTVLLGHNGAGKSTTMNMITGLFPPTEGSIIINGYDVCGELGQEARRSIGLCPQENIFFPELSVFHHMLIFCLIRNPSLKWAEGREEVKKLLLSLKLSKKSNVRTSQLSGGMKRKLQLGMAMIGGASLLILDEPSSGMDPEARRVIWDVLLAARRKRTILLTTHFMEEADVLGDRIVIMNAGRVECSGTTMFLKRRFGAGYLLRIAKKGFLFDKGRFFAQFLLNYAPAAVEYSDSKTEIVYSLGGRKSLQMDRLAQELESSGTKMGVDSFGMSYSSLEDVFLAVGSDERKRLGVDYLETQKSDVNFEITHSTPGMSMPKMMLKQQLIGLLLKRFHFAKRYIPVLLFQILLPVGILVAAIFVDQLFRSKLDEIAEPKTKFPMNTHAIYGKELETFFKDSSDWGLGKSWKNIHEQRYAGKVITLRQDEYIIDWALRRAKETNIGYYSQRLLYGLEVAAKKVLRLWFNSDATQSFPLAVINLFEAVLSMIPGGGLINITNEPRFNQTNKNSLEDERPEASKLMMQLMPDLGLKLLISLIMLPVAVTFLAASYILFPIHENMTNSKHLQLMTGLPVWLFWLGNLIFDMAVHCTVTGLIVILINIIDKKGLALGGEIMISFVYLMFFFGLATISLAYLLTPAFGTPTQGFTTLVIVYMVIGLMLAFFMSILDFYVQFFVSNVEKESEPVMMSLLPLMQIIPIFTFLFGFQKVSRWQAYTSMCTKILPTSNENFTAMLEMLRKNSNGEQDFFMDSMIRCNKDFCGDRCYRKSVLWRSDQLGPRTQMLFLAFSALFFFVLLLALESDVLGINEKLAKWVFFFKNLVKQSKLKKASVAETKLPKLKEDSDINLELEDADVRAERLRIECEQKEGKQFTDLLTVDRLTKRYNNDFLAVDQLTFGVQFNEVFGFLGVNGAGKTTTFSMLTGSEVPTSGEAYLLKGSIGLTTQKRWFQERLGYCPQFDAFLEKLNAYETLSLFARLRGVDRVAEEVVDCINLVGLDYITAARRVETYSGGNRRKLSICMAIIGRPQLVLLDEPTSGVDPAARRKIWAALRSIRRRTQCSIVLTSHSMDECEALSSRIAIMVNGRFRCVGSTQRLRSKYGQGFYIMIKISASEIPKSSSSNRLNIDQTIVKLISKVRRAVRKTFPHAKLKDAHQTILYYHLANPNDRWSSIFSGMEKIKARGIGVEDYVVSGTTLEQIFLIFARSQRRVD